MVAEKIWASYNKQLRITHVQIIPNATNPCGNMHHVASKCMTNEYSRLDKNLLKISNVFDILICCISVCF